MIKEPFPEKILSGSLFSLYYLIEQLPKTKYWDKCLEKADNVKMEIADLYESMKTLLSSLNASQIELQFIRPLLKLLGFEFDDQPPVLACSNINNKTYYTLFLCKKDKETAISLKSQKTSNNYFKLVTILCTVEQPDKNFDKGKKRVSSILTRQYLRNTGVNWGILTNGRLWRLYFRESSYSFNLYYQIDLLNLLQSKLDFRYFYCFFSSDSFRALRNKKRNIDRIYNQNLKFSIDFETIFVEKAYTAVKLLVMGFLYYSPNNLSARDLPVIYDNSIILFYRFLFILYAESRLILPMNSKKYEKISLTNIRKEIMDPLKQEDFSISEKTIYERLKILFQFINRGSLQLGVNRTVYFIPAYKGTLFDKEKYPFLLDKEISDKFLSQAIRVISYWKSAFLDYKLLPIRYIGSIYEKFLELPLDGVKTVLNAPKMETGASYFSFFEDRLIKAQFGDSRVRSSRDSRKLSGSFFTPDIIVKYIIERNLDSFIEDLQKTSTSAEEILNLKILDPAMGSGYFLLEAINYLATKYLEQTQILEEINPREIKLKIASNCVYGVDRNPLAVELAKISLWIDIALDNRPLPFLDHHLKVGNSLIGAEIKPLFKLDFPENVLSIPLNEPFQKNTNIWNSDLDLLKILENITNIPSIDSKFIKQEEYYAQFKNNEIYRASITLANAYLSYYFGNEEIAHDYPRMLEAFSELLDGKRASWEKQKAILAVKQAEQLAVEKQFFHWHIEFPDVFINNISGFSAVIGNPPWGEEVIQEDKEFFARYWGLPIRNLNAFDLFFRRAVNLTSSKVSFLIPRNSVNRNDYSLLRKFIVKKTWLFDIYDWKLFPGVVQECISIIVSRKDQIKPEKIIINLTPIFSQEDIKPPLYIFNIHSTKEEYALKEKIKRNSQIGMLKSILDPDIGIKRGEEISKAANILRCPKCNKWRLHSKRKSVTCPNCHKTFQKDEWFIGSMVSTENSKDAVLVVTGDDIARFYLNPSLYINFNPAGIKTKAHLGIYFPNKILVKKIESKIVAAFDPSNSYYTQNVYGLRLAGTTRYSFYYILAILNSIALNFFYEHEINLGAEWTTAVSINNIKNHLPIPEVGLDLGFEGIWGLDEIDVMMNVTTNYFGRIPLFMSDIDVYHLITFFSKEITYWCQKLQEERKLFLNWMQNTWDFNIDSINGKSYLTQYWKYEVEKILKVLKRNKKHLSEDPNSLNSCKKLKIGFSKSISKNKFINEIISQTLPLMEALIFRLYKLTFREVRFILKRSDLNPTFIERVLGFYSIIEMKK
ncbi:MAG: Eco57I restriction-modification methylase domain-containing protein [Candidatus Hermodarchaeota archaeon]